MAINLIKKSDTAAMPARFKVGDRLKVADHLKGEGYDYLRGRELIVKTVVPAAKPPYTNDGGQIVYDFGLPFALREDHAEPFGRGC